MFQKADKYWRRIRMRQAPPLPLQEKNPKQSKTQVQWREKYFFHSTEGKLNDKCNNDGKTNMKGH